MHCEPEVVGRLHLGTADDLPFPDGSFDCVISLNTIHNFAARARDRGDCARSSACPAAAPSSKLTPI